uniref:Uncharacterized protein n=1 Tax=viral metagenome TaxID=1070528 RepID=A0A6C0LHN4_9ZZZZ
MSKGYVYKLESTIENDNRYYYGCTLWTESYLEDLESRNISTYHKYDDKLRRV